jgi:hypothetical protein
MPGIDCIAPRIANVRFSEPEYDAETVRTDSGLPMRSANAYTVDFKPSLI